MESKTMSRQREVPFAGATAFAGMVLPDLILPSLILPSVLHPRGGLDPPFSLKPKAEI